MGVRGPTTPVEHRFRGVVAVESLDGEVRTAGTWVPLNGRVRQLRGAKVTQDRYGLDSVVCVKARGMKEPWCLAVGGATITGATAVTLLERGCLRDRGGLMQPSDSPERVGSVWP